MDFKEWWGKTPVCMFSRTLPIATVTAAKNYASEAWIESRKQTIEDVLIYFGVPGSYKDFFRKMLMANHMPKQGPVPTPKLKETLERFRRDLEGK